MKKVTTAFIALLFLAACNGGKTNTVESSETKSLKGVISIENAKVLNLKPFSDIGTPMEIINGIFGGNDNFEKAIKELEIELFK